ncbi:alpha/beta fold hydrolase [Agromyces aerolatus]|uniref:alpha/beta fold hydrolase n=1 Tax=Agromyces sp. LY-1074 TaxID=3074080 RepID=UPI0028667826|nr:MULTISPECIES: alpha/beta fold hydrolase [unclassified Agromyces]MDR5701061.1 alpha/beta fold hydrolase [Agromyces sp. LY-1074]MDR5707701.1 alpha/beta fold hydrolase [Agromyces sp. LY-1358]
MPERASRDSFRRRVTDASIRATPAGVLAPPPPGWESEAAALDRAIPDFDWRALPDGAEQDLFEAPSGPLARISFGPEHGTRVVLVPGATGSKEDFVLMLPLLAAAGYRAEAFDLAGQYESYRAGPWRLTPPRARYDADLFLGDLVAVLESGRSPSHVLGYSFAGSLAQRALVDRPELFASLALLSSPPQPGQAFRGIKRIGPLSAFTNARQGAALMLWGIRNNLNRVPPGRLAFVRDRFRLTRRDSVDDIIAEMMRTPDLRDAVAASPVPKLVAAGAHDLWPTELHARSARELGARFAVYETGHSPCETAPHQLVRDLLELYAGG